MIGKRSCQGLEMGEGFDCKGTKRTLEGVMEQFFILIVVVVTVLCVFLTENCTLRRA